MNLRLSLASSLRKQARLSVLALAALVLSTGLSGCVMVGGYTSGGGWFLFPGLGALIVIFLIFTLLRRRR